jgi:hypothetical protein
MLIANQFNVPYTTDALGQNSTIVTRARSTTRLAVHPKHVHTTLVTFLCAAANAEQQRPRLGPGLLSAPSLCCTWQEAKLLLVTNKTLSLSIKEKGGSEQGPRAGRSAS